MRNKITSILFILMLLTGAGLHLLLPDRVYSERERRKLEPLPDVSARSILSGEFGRKLETYLADQFPGREDWVALQTITERILGKRESGGVYYADDGYLIEACRSLNNRQLAANTQAVKALQDELDGLGIPMHTLLVPTASQILHDKLPPYAPNADQQTVTDYVTEKGLHTVVVSPILSEHKDEYIYYKTDHHWTSLGAYYAYAAWMQSKGQRADRLDAWQKETLATDFRGTTYNKVNDPWAAYDTIDAYYKNVEHSVDYNRGYYVTKSIYERRYLDCRDKYAVFLNSNQETTVVRRKTDPNGTETREMEDDPGGKLLIIKDSYANTFAQFVVDDYAETHLIDLRFFRGSVLQYIREQGITEVLVLYSIPDFAAETAIPHCSR